MARKQAALVELDLRKKGVLEKIIRSRTLGTCLKDRGRIVLAAAEGLENRQIEKTCQFEEHRVSAWRTRWHKQHEAWKQSEPTLRPKMSEKRVCQWPADAKGRGKKPEITNEQPEHAHV